MPYIDPNKKAIKKIHNNDTTLKINKYTGSENRFFCGLLTSVFLTVVGHCSCSRVAFLF